MQETSPHPLDWSAADAALAALLMLRLAGTGSDAELTGYVAATGSLAPHHSKMALLSALVPEMADAPDGLETVLDLIGAVETDAAPTIYMLSADYVAHYGTASPEEMRLLEKLGEALKIDRLTRAAFDVAAQARSTPLEEYDV